MKQRIKLLSAVYLLYLVLNIMSGALSGIFSDIVFALSFILPIVLVLAYIGRDGEVSPKEYLKINSDGMRVTVAFSAPSLLVISLLSYVTALILEWAVGDFPTPTVPDTFFAALITSALFPALIEEIMFRLVPMCALKGFSKKGTVILSALFFAFAHASVYQIPYALFAGVVFMLVDIMTGSILPSVILHFVNNLTSLVFILFKDVFWVKCAVNVSFGLLFVLSLAFFIRYKKKICENFKGVLSDGEKGEYTAAPLFFIIPAAILALEELFVK